MDDCFDRLMFKNRPGIQTASSIFFTVNSILVMVFLFSVLMAEDAAVQLKLSSIDSNPAEIQFAGSLVVSSFYISSLMDLYLIIGIEDNSRVPMLAYMWWSSFTTMAHALALIAIAIWKSNKENVSGANRTIRRHCWFIRFIEGLLHKKSVPLQHAGAEPGLRRCRSGRNVCRSCCRRAIIAAAANIRTS
ncbi:uncharacterized protein LOC119382513 isoform X2 [Rhipicephalus sanguineus]|uniref:uncharacterized protein LOC119382513 isoform X2 n=1 Tax=Rhipicephalus sanguineus TaxID=34632 RepID=UPI001894FE33|nr:uncharacterized protein LOC119382513 isoform X2 [Rhipicephalus sanguineus]